MISYIFIRKKITNIYLFCKKNLHEKKHKNIINYNYSNNSCQYLDRVWIASNISDSKNLVDPYILS